MFDHLIVRGDESCWARDEKGGFPFVDNAAQAGATGLHIWGLHGCPADTRSVFVARCRECKLTLHAGMGVCSYGVCDGEDPADPKVQRKLKDHLSRMLESADIAGIEFQTGEYDTPEYDTGGAKGKRLGRTLADNLNPMIDFALKQKKSLWIRTELHAGHFAYEDVLDVSKSLDPRCTVEWSQFVGPFHGKDALAQGRELLALDSRFSWFLKNVYHIANFWREPADGWLPSARGATRRSEVPQIVEFPSRLMTPKGMAAWADYWREWVKTLYEAKRKTLTICHVPMRMPDDLSRLLLAATALARDPELPNDHVLSLLGVQKTEAKS